MLLRPTIRFPVVEFQQVFGHLSVLGQRFAPGNVHAGGRKAVDRGRFH